MSYSIVYLSPFLYDFLLNFSISYQLNQNLTASIYLLFALKWIKQLLYLHSQSSLSISLPCWCINEKMKTKTNIISSNIYSQWQPQVDKEPVIFIPYKLIHWNNFFFSSLIFTYQKREIATTHQVLSGTNHHRKKKTENIRKRKGFLFSIFLPERYNWKLPQQLPLFWRGNFDDKSWKDIIRIMDMGVLLYYIRVSTLVADGMECFSFSHDIDFVARPDEEVGALHRVAGRRERRILFDGT